MSEQFYVTGNPDGSLTPHWVEGEQTILCSVELIKQMIDQYNYSIELREQYENVDSAEEPNGYLKLREQIARDIEADHTPIERQTYGGGFTACVCGHMIWPCELGARAANIARGK